jgi:predicted ATPase
MSANKRLRSARRTRRQGLRSPRRCMSSGRLFLDRGVLASIARLRFTGAPQNKSVAGLREGFIVGRQETS